MIDLKNAKTIHGYNIKVFIEEKKYKKLKEIARNESTTIDLLIEQLIDEKLKKNLMKGNKRQ